MTHTIECMKQDLNPNFVELTLDLGLTPTFVLGVLRAGIRVEPTLGTARCHLTKGN